MSRRDLFEAAFLGDPFVRKGLELLDRDGEAARVIGGAVRNALLGLPPAQDIDIATTALPQTVIERAEAAGIKAVPTGIEHGTVTLVGRHRVLEVTTLREDIETDGRRAIVRFGRDWTADALRRDFTINALSVDRQGELFDPVGGEADLEARRIRFIGDADGRIAEDRLRVLRFFRFNAIYGEGEPDAAGLSAAIRARNDLDTLSAERIGQEMRKLVVAPRAAATVRVMQESGILTRISGGVGDLVALDRAEAYDAPGEAVAPLRFVILFGRVQEDIDGLVRRLRLGNQERDRMTAGFAAAEAVAHGARDADRALHYRIGTPALLDGFIIAAAKGWIAEGEATARIGAAKAWAVPTFPLSGRDVVETGIGRGPAVGVLLRHLEKGWIAENFRPDRDELLRRLQNLIAAAQQ